MLGAPGRYDPTLYAGQPGGDDEVHWFRLCLRGLALEDRIDVETVEKPVEENGENPVQNLVSRPATTTAKPNQNAPK